MDKAHVTTWEVELNDIPDAIAEYINKGYDLKEVVPIETSSYRCYSGFMKEKVNKVLLIFIKGN